MAVFGHRRLEEFEMVWDGTGMAKRKGESCAQSPRRLLIFGTSLNHNTLR